VEGEPKIRSYASIGNMMRAMQSLRSQNRKVSAVFVQDANMGSKLFASNSFYVVRGNTASAFLLEQDARTAATTVGGGAKVVNFQSLQQALLPGGQPFAFNF
jgi:NitT/TauT family transport system substrate-binding protein